MPLSRPRLKSSMNPVTAVAVMEPNPDRWVYVWAAYALVALLLAGYAAVLIWRAQRLRAHKLDGES